MQCNTSKHSTRLTINHINALIARAVPISLECRDHVAKPLLKPLLCSEHNIDCVFWPEADITMLILLSGSIASAKVAGTRCHS